MHSPNSSGNIICKSENFFRFFKYVFTIGLLFWLTGCGGTIPIPMIDKRTQSAYLYKPEAYIFHYYSKYMPPKIGIAKDKIYIYFYKYVFRYNGFYIKFTPPYEVQSFSTDDISDLHSISYQFVVYYDEDDKQKKWPIYMFLFDGTHNKLYVEWDIVSKGSMKGHRFEEGNLRIFLLKKDTATAKEKRAFSRYEKIIAKVKEIEAKRAAKANAAMNAYAAYLLGAFSSQFKSAVSDSLNHHSRSGKAYRLEYEGYTKWNKHYVYNVYYQGQYEGQIFYYYDNDGTATVQTVSLDHGRYVIGNYYGDTKTLHTTQCGNTRANSIEEAVEKVAKCAYENHY